MSPASAPPKPVRLYAPRDEAFVCHWGRKAKCGKPARNLVLFELHTYWVCDEHVEEFRYIGTLGRA